MLISQFWYFRFIFAKMGVAWGRNTQPKRRSAVMEIMFVKFPSVNPLPLIRPIFICILLMIINYCLIKIFSNRKDFIIFKSNWLLPAVLPLDRQLLFSKLHTTKTLYELSDYPLISGVVFDVRTADAKLYISLFNITIELLGLKNSRKHATLKTVDKIFCHELVFITWWYMKFRSYRHFLGMVLRKT